MPKVYFAKPDGLEKIINLMPELPGRLGVKVHFGEEGNETFVPAKLIKPIIETIKNPTLIEASVLYKSPRSRATTHKELALKHGFDFAPIDFLDGEEGDDIIELPGLEKHFKTCYFGKGLEKYSSLLVISHFKGHMMAGFGGAIKNTGMGMASRRGKLALHASIQHQVDAEKCISCGACVENCPAKAISFDGGQKASIDEKLCISCSKCISICPNKAIAIPWNTAPQTVEERIAEYAKAGTNGKKCFYINFLINITDKCDCAGEKLKILTPDIGILASDDPVAIDQACFDLTSKQYPEFKNICDGENQVIYGEKIGLGQRRYELIEL